MAVDVPHGDHVRSGRGAWLSHSDEKTIVRPIIEFRQGRADSGRSTRVHILVVGHRWSRIHDPGARIEANREQILLGRGRRVGAATVNRQERAFRPVGPIIIIESSIEQNGIGVGALGAQFNRNRGSQTHRQLRYRCLARSVVGGGHVQVTVEHIQQRPRPDRVVVITSAISVRVGGCQRKVRRGRRSIHHVSIDLFRIGEVDLIVDPIIKRAAHGRTRSRFKSRVHRNAEIHAGIGGGPEEILDVVKKSVVRADVAHIVGVVDVQVGVVIPSFVGRGTAWNIGGIGVVQGKVARRAAAALPGYHRIGHPHRPGCAPVWARGPYRHVQPGVRGRTILDPRNPGPIHGKHG